MCLSDTIQKFRKGFSKRKITPLLTLGEYRLFRTIYVWAAVFIVLVISGYIGYQGAVVHQTNADQIVNPYLFESVSVAHGAQYPSQHTFLLKWPLFFIIRIFHYSTASYIGMTIAVMIVTVGALALLLYRIERRPLVFGTLCLALASTLLLIPAQPYVGGILPVNMAMVATRNIEYIVFILSLLLITWPGKKRSFRFIGGVVLLGLLIASDQLFLSLSIGASVVALLSYAVRHRTSYISAASRWLAGGIMAVGVAGLVVVGLRVSNLVGIVTAAAPFGLISSVKNLIIGLFYSIAGVFTNYGANPAYDATRIPQVPAVVVHRLVSLSGPSYLINTLILVSCFGAILLLLRRGFVGKRPKAKIPKAVFLATTLAWLALASIALFVISNHYYPVDSRYLAITWFAGFVCLAVTSRTVRFSADKVLLVGIMLLISIGLGVFGSTQTAHTQRAVYTDMTRRDHRVIKALESRKMPVLLGDYWRVLPIRQQAKRPIVVQPLASCNQLRTVLTSSVWKQNLESKPFAYLLSLDRSLTDFPQCSIPEVIKAYGPPNESVLIAGTLAKPTEVLLFYDTNKKPNAATQVDTATVLPVEVSDVPNTTCRNATTLNFVAHQDDDILFLNPDITIDLQSGRCVRTVFVTAGDGGHGAAYVAGRERGAQAGYATLLHAKNIWLQRIVRLPGGEYVRISNLKDHPEVSLIFMRLPDGGLDGAGFAATRYQSLSKLEKGAITKIRSVDQQSTYTKAALESALSELMALYNPAEIRTLSSLQGNVLRDHSDHGSTGRFTTRAHDAYQQQKFENLLQVPISYYVGYPIRESPVNVVGAPYDEKLAAFLAYSKYDGGVCHSAEECANTPTYGSYLSREYQNSN